MAKTPAKLMEQAQRLINEAKRVEKEYCTEIGAQVLKAHRAGKLEVNAIAALVEKYFGKTEPAAKQTELATASTTTAQLDKSSSDDESI